MIDDFLTCCERVTLETEVCIAGAGAAGITLARALMAAGIDVCVLESGGLDYEEPVQDLARGASVGFPYYPLADARLRFFGGTTAIWGGRSAELNAIDFEHRPWVEHSGWPFGKDALRPYYERALRLLDLEAPGEGDELWERVGLAPPAVRSGVAARGPLAVRRAVRALHHRPLPGPPGLVPRPRPAACDRR